MRNRTGERWLEGAGIGAALAWLFDREVGRRRRARVRDRVVHGLHRMGDVRKKGRRDLSNRAHGMWAEAKALLGDGAVTQDDVLAQRVRAQLGRTISHPRAVAVSAQGGVVALRGPILTRESAPLLRAVYGVRGVTGIRDQLERHPSAEHIPALQGGTERSGKHSELGQWRWAPGTRLLLGTLGAGFGLLGLLRRRSGARGLGLVGLALVARAVGNRPLVRMIGARGAPHAFRFQKTAHVNAPIGEVFGFWSRPENFPRFMQHVREVSVAGGGRSHWKVAGPGGSTVEWDAEITRCVPEQVIAWRTLPGAAVDHEGTVRFEPRGEATRLDIQMSYDPPAGVLGHALAALFGSDPKRAMDDAVLRMKSLLEQGKTRAHGERVTAEELRSSAGHES